MTMTAETGKGMVHVYTGNGKGKTTAAIGLAIRAVGAGRRVFFAQFLKGQPTSEVAVLRTLTDRITVERFGGRAFVRNGGTAGDAREVASGMRQATLAIASGEYSIVILDELNVAAAMGLVEVDRVVELIRSVRPGMTLVLTGRYAPDAIIEAADLVTEMREVKHYYNRGVAAQAGIEM